METLRERSIADYLWEKAESKLTPEQFTKWLRYVYSDTQKDFSRKALKVINKRIETLAKETNVISSYKIIDTTDLGEWQYANSKDLWGFVE